MYSITDVLTSYLAKTNQSFYYHLEGFNAIDNTYNKLYPTIYHDMLKDVSTDTLNDICLGSIMYNEVHDARIIFASIVLELFPDRVYSTTKFRYINMKNINRLYFNEFPNLASCVWIWKRELTNIATIETVMEFYQFTDMKIVDYLQKMVEVCKIDKIYFGSAAKMVSISGKLSNEAWNDFVRIIIDEVHIFEVLAFIKDKLEDLDAGNADWLNQQVDQKTIKLKENVGFFEKYLEYRNNRIKFMESTVNKIQSSHSYRDTYVIVGDQNMSIEGLKNYIMTGQR